MLDAVATRANEIVPVPSQLMGTPPTDTFALVTYGGTEETIPPALSGPYELHELVTVSIYVPLLNDPRSTLDIERTLGDLTDRLVLRLLRDTQLGGIVERVEFSDVAPIVAQHNGVWCRIYGVTFSVWTLDAYDQQVAP